MSHLILLAGLAEEVGGWLLEGIDGVTLEIVDSLAEVRRALAAAEAPALVVVSQQLTGAAGEEVVAEARASSSHSRVPTIFCLESLAGEELGRRLVEEQSVDQLLVFPLDRRELVRHGARLLGVEPRGGADVGESIPGGVAAVWDRYRNTVMARVEVLEDAGIALLDGTLTAARRANAAREANKLAGSLGGFGFAHGSRIARQGEQILAGSSEIQPQDVFRLAELVVLLRGELEAGGGQSRGDFPERTATLLILGADRTFSEQIVFAAAARGLRAIAAGRGGDARVKMMGLRPEIVVIDTSFDDLHASKDRVLQLLADIQPPIPAIIIGGNESLRERSLALQWGARSFLRKPIPAARVIGEAERILRSVQPQRGRILVVDEDPETLATLERILALAQLDIVALTDPLEVLPRLASQPFDLLILDRDLPRLTGIELCRVLRSDPRWQNLPILILAEHRRGVVQQIFEAGADDFVGKPLVDQELTTRISNRLERSRLYRNLADTDLDTGLPNRWRSSEMIELLRRLAERHRQPLLLAIIQVDSSRDAEGDPAAAGGNQMLADLADLLVPTFRSHDVVGRWSADRLVLAMYGTAREEGTTRLHAALEASRRPEAGSGPGRRFPGVRAGVALFPDDGTSINTLCSAAEAALHGPVRSHVAIENPNGSGKEPAGADEAPFDVLVVQDDDALTALLTHALEARGYRTLSLPDGHDALTWLSPGSGASGARVILLDVDLPGLDGLALLRRLNGLGVTTTSRVIVLTARASEREVLEALRNGAFDHIPKPFSVPVLMHRVGQALEA